MVTTNYKVRLPVEKRLRIAVAADVHSSPKYEEIIRLIDEAKPDAILIPGDLCHAADDCDIPLKFLRFAVDIAPVYYSFGNHERSTDESLFDIDGVHLLNDKYESFGEVFIGGLRSGFRGQHETSLSKTPVPDLSFLDEFEKVSGVKLLMSHHPEYYPRYLCDRDLDIIFSGHAHGGQWRLFGRGLFAPGQGLFPRYTEGMHGSMIVSRGLANKVILPRIFNEPELVVADICPSF